ncbi:MAG: Fic family protein [Planctomycetes bacterium]|nr:Fic family protein [Planctomycetota bacterium]
MKAETISGLAEFIVESNRIEGISGAPKMEPSYAFLTLDEPSLEDLCEFVRGEAGAELRTEANMNVIVGNHRPPPGGPGIAIELSKLIRLAIDNDATPFAIHRRYETLHPFMDGNGRSGRILWAWQMIEHNIRPGLSLGFLHAFYYQTLAAR